jgi:3-hydroxy-9,10-secoandrosta-1,3,5(10)-triene-9,17-dione monooxygenase
VQPVSPGGLSPPEPDLTPEQIIARAQELVPVLRARQEECEALGRLPDSTSRELVEAGFYRILQPRRFGGYEFDLRTFSLVAIELSRGCPSTGWTYAFVAGHAHLLAALFSEEGQIDVYGDTGEVRMPGNIRPQPAKRVEDGFRITGAWDYVSGCDSATHYVLGAQIPAEGGVGDPTRLTCILNAASCSIVDNWDVHGMRGTGSRRIVAEEVFVPAHRTIGPLDSAVVRYDAETRDMPGRTVHRNPMYAAGGIFSVLFGETMAVAIGIARGALDIYEQTLATRTTMITPIVPMKDHPQYQRAYAEALQQIDGAESILLGCDRDYMQWSRRDVEEGIPFSAQLEQRLILRKQLCAKLSADAIDLMARTAGSSIMKRGELFERYRRDMTMLMTHPTVQSELNAETYGRLHFGWARSDGSQHAL